MAKKKASKKVKINQFLKEKGLHDLINNYLKENNLEEVELKSIKFTVSLTEQFRHGECNTLICDDDETKVEIGRVNGRMICKCIPNKERQN